MSEPLRDDPAQPRRRQGLVGAGAAGLSLALPGAWAAATPSPTTESDMTSIASEQTDRVLIADLIARERAARDAGLWAEMGALYHADSSIDVSWFKGTGAQFTAATEKMAAGPLYTFHQMGEPVITIVGDRALVDSNSTVHAFTKIEGVEVDLISYGRLQWRAQRSGERWLVAGLRAIYIRDVLAPVNPQQVPQLDGKLLAGFRPSYRFISYVTAKAGHPARDDLPGVDKPETVAALRAGEQQWLQQRKS